MVKIVVEGAPKHAEDCPFAVDINLTNDYTCLLQPLRGLKCDIERKKYATNCSLWRKKRDENLIIRETER